MTLSAVTLVTPPHTDQCDYCMCIRLVNKHDESKPFQCISDREPHVTHCVNNTKQQRQIKCEQIQTRVVREVTFITVTLNNTVYLLWWRHKLFLVQFMRAPYYKKMFTYSQVTVVTGHS